MGQLIEAQRAIIEGYDFMVPYKIFEARAKLVIPSGVALLKTYDDLTFLSLQGFWEPEKRYIVTNNMFMKAMIAASEGYPFLLTGVKAVENIRPRTIILEDGRVFRKYNPNGWIPYDPDEFPEKEYEKKVFVPGQPFNFEVIWERVGEMNNPKVP